MCPMKTTSVVAGYFDKFVYGMFPGLRSGWIVC